MGVTLVILIIVAIAIWYFAKYQSTASHFASSDHDPVGSINGPGEYDIEVVGESHYQRALESICGGRREESAEKYVKAQLILEDENSHDPYAVRVDIQGKTIGYLARKTARQYRSKLQKAGHARLTGVCKAVIRGGWDRGSNDRGHFGVWLDLPSH